MGIFGQPCLQFLWFNIVIFIKFFVVTNLSFVCAGVLFKRLCKLICRLVVQTGILFVLGIRSVTGSEYEMLCRSYCSMVEINCRLWDCVPNFRGLLG